MKATERFAEFAGQFIKIEEGHTTVYVPAPGDYDDDEIMFTVENYHPMEFLEDGQVVVALSFHGTDRSDEPVGFIAVDDDEDSIWVYEDGNDEPLPTAASDVTLTPVGG